ncbi:MAG TPA: hypothetical protein VKE88_00255, partial [Candidatus Nanoarchaeia archaeon]|nr:hypothetical protein [Candidatus Nanoarchaeia archaeon]
MELYKTIRNAALGLTLALSPASSYAAKAPAQISQTAQVDAQANSPAAYVPRIVDSEKNTFNAAVYDSFNRALEMGLSEKEAVISVKNSTKLSQKRTEQFLKQFYALPVSGT